MHSPSEAAPAASSPPESPATPDYRQMLVVRHDLGMRRGKLAAQAAHASMAVLTRGAHTCIAPDGQGGQKLVVTLDDELYAWLTGAFKKVCVYVKGEEALRELHRQALAAGLRCALIKDRGLTEFGGVPTVTVLAIGPHEKLRLDPLTGHLPLY